MESFWGRFKTENRTLIREAQTLSEITELIPERIDYYNRERRHSSLGQIAPWTVLADTLSKNGQRQQRLLEYPSHCLGNPRIIST